MSDAKGFLDMFLVTGQLNSTIISPSYLVPLKSLHVKSRLTSYRQHHNHHDQGRTTDSVG